MGTVFIHAVPSSLQVTVRVVNPSKSPSSPSKITPSAPFIWKKDDVFLKLTDDCISSFYETFHISDRTRRGNQSNVVCAAPVKIFRYPFKTHNRQLSSSNTSIFDLSPRQVNVLVAHFFVVLSMESQFISFEPAPLVVIVMRLAAHERQAERYLFNNRCYMLNDRSCRLRLFQLTDLWNGRRRKTWIGWRNEEEKENIEVGDMQH